MMILLKDMEAIKKLLELQIDTIPGGVLYLIFEGDTIVWRKSSQSFDLDIFNIGDKMKENSIASKALKSKQIMEVRVPESLYGVRLKTIAIPLFDEESNSVGVLSIVMPRVHPIAQAFPDFAPILANMFPEGSVLYLTDSTKVIAKQRSDKYDVPFIDLGYKMQGEDTPLQTLQTKKLVQLEREAFGSVIRECSYPLFDEENPDDVVATLGVIIPKIIAGNLRKMSQNLENGVTSIAAAIEELAASATTIHTNQTELNEEINEITHLSEQINEISSFIKKIADETNMLGLNAAIEAARAGEAGKGFNVVAGEIRKLSEQSKSTVPKIKLITDQIVAKVEETSQKSKISLDIIQEQAAASEEMAASIEHITGMSEELNQIANEV
jgi:hypothetical protein